MAPKSTAARELAALLDGSAPERHDGDDAPDDPGHDYEPEWQGHAAALVTYLKPFVRGDDVPSVTEQARLARAFEALLGEQYRRLLALRVVERWRGAKRAGGIDALMVGLRRLAPEISKPMQVARRHVDAILGRTRTGGRRMAAPAILATLSLLSGAFGIAKRASFSDQDVKREAEKFRSARETHREEKNASRRQRAKQPNSRRKRKERDG